MKCLLSGAVTRISGAQKRAGGVAGAKYSIEMIRRNNGHYRLDHAVSKRQKVILGSFGMDADSICSIAAEIDQMLEKNKSLMEESNEEEKEVYENGTNKNGYFD